MPSTTRRESGQNVKRLTLLNAPELLRSKRPLGVDLPKIVKGVEEDEIPVVVPEGVAQALDGLALVHYRRHSLSIGLSCVRPAGFSNDGAFPTCRRDTARDVTHISACVLGGLSCVEESVAVCGTIVRDVAEFRVRKDLGECIDCHDGAGVSQTTEESAGIANGAGDLCGRRLAAVDEFVADCDSVEDGEVRFSSVDDGLEACVEVVKAVDTGKDFHVMATGCVDDFAGLVAVYTINADKGIVG